jgi:uncharacterized protein YwgA
MTKGRIILKLVLDAAHEKVELGTFPQRLELQKKIYLLQALGLDMGYRYNWYLKGPYSPSAAEDLFALRDEIAAGQKEFEDFDLSKEALPKIQNATGLWTPPSATSSSEWVELLASLHFLEHSAFWAKKTGMFNDVCAKLLRAKPQFSRQTTLVISAWNKLCDAGLISRAKKAKMSQS